MENSWNGTDRRQFDRHPLMLEAQVTIGAESFAVLIFHISAGGAKVQSLDAGKVAEIVLPKGGMKADRPVPAPPSRITRRIWPFVMRRI